jgi:hypothetical protein
VLGQRHTATNPKSGAIAELYASVRALVLGHKPRAVPWLCCCGLLGCVLPSFEKIEIGEAQLWGETCGLSERLPQPCDVCIRDRCCDLAVACGEGTDCGADLLEPITPVAEFSAEFEPLLGCLQAECARECQVHWGCVGDYGWPAEAPIDPQVRTSEACTGASMKASSPDAGT